MRVAPIIGLLPALLGLTPALRAEPEWNVAAETSLCGRGDHGSVWKKTGFCGGFRGDVLFGRERNADFALGPYATFGTATFSDLRFGGGLSLLLPVSESFPLVLEAGPHLRNLDQPGVFASVFFGLRSFNHYGHYEMAAGLSVTAERSFTTSTPSALWITARIDGSWIALPFVFAYNALR